MTKTMTLSSWTVHVHEKKRQLWEEEATTKTQEQMKEREPRSCVDVLVLLLVPALVHVLVLVLFVVDRFPEEGMGRNAVAVSVAVSSSSLDK